MIHLHSTLYSLPSTLFIHNSSFLTPPLASKQLSGWGGKPKFKVEEWNCSIPLFYPLPSKTTDYTDCTD